MWSHMRVHHILNSRLRLRRSPSRRRGENLYEPVPTALLFLACSLRKVDRTFPLEQAKEGHDYLEAGRSRGKVLYEI